MYKFSTNSLSMQSAPEGSRISPFVLYQLTVAFSVCVNLCGQLCMYVDKSMSVHIHVLKCMYFHALKVCVSVPTGGTHSGLLLAGCEEMKLWRPCLYWCTRFGNF